MKITFSLLLFLISQSVFAACVSPPRSPLVLGDVRVIASADTLYVAWPTTDVNEACCFRVKVDGETLSTRITSLSGAVPQTVPEALLKLSVIPLPAPSAEDFAQCRKMFDVIIPVWKVIPNTLRADGSRPLKALKDSSLPYSATNPLVNLIVSGKQMYVEAGQTCKSTPVVYQSGTSRWLYTKNSSGQEGIALCKT